MARVKGVKRGVKRGAAAAPPAGPAAAAAAAPALPPDLLLDIARRAFELKDCSLEALSRFSAVCVAWRNYMKGEILYLLLCKCSMLSPPTCHTLPSSGAWTHHVAAQGGAPLEVGWQACKAR